MDADGGNTGLHRLVVERINELLVIEPPRVLRRLRLQRIADCIAFPAVGFDLGNATVDFFHPAGLARRKQRMEQKAFGARNAVDGLVRELDLVIGQKPGRRIVERSTAQQRHLGVAVQVYLFEKILEFIAIERDPEPILQ